MDMQYFQLSIKLDRHTKVIRFEANNNPQDIMRVARSLAKIHGLNLKEVPFEIQMIAKP